ncbi:concanavalin A-like lectin/glucanase, partial [Jaminaea rosea]
VVDGALSSPSSTLKRRPIFKSQLWKPDRPIHKPWVESKSRKRDDRNVRIAFACTILLGVIAGIGLIALGYLDVPRHKYCLVLQEDFQGTEINSNVWFHEQETGGFGNNEFEWTTSSKNNSFVKDGKLYLVPTLTSDNLGEAAILDGYTLNLTQAGICTSTNTSDAYCAAASNATLGHVLPPVQSARLVTNFSTAIKYGRIEVKAKMPTGDWIWPAIWMLPRDQSRYGPWPRSGEIDIFESRGNILEKHADDTYNRMHSTLHWGLDSATDRYAKTTAERQLYRKFYNEDFHTFGLEWTPEGIFTWEGSPINKVFAWKFTESFWNLGNFPAISSQNGTAYSNPWVPLSNSAAPFDQEFYLILNVAVGGTNGYFKEETMPWSNTADINAARSQFWAAKDQWYSTWPEAPEDRGMVVESVKIWQ